MITISYGALVVMGIGLAFFIAATVFCFISGLFDILVCDDGGFAATLTFIAAVYFVAFMTPSVLAFALWSNFG